MKIVVTGGAGFIGSNFIRYWSRKYPQDSIVNLDNLSYAGIRETVQEFKKNPRILFVKGDIRNASLIASVLKKADLLFHFAAETHVDRSILDSQIFLQTNVLGTHVLLECARKRKLRFLYVSTDEVYGSIRKGRFREDSPIRPNSPYAVSKAAADLLCRSYWITHQMPLLITRGCNNFGPYQFPEKVIPLFITNLIEGKQIPLYGKGGNVREWIYVQDHCKAIDLISQKGKDGEIFNIGSGIELSNIALSRRILRLFRLPDSMIQMVPDRPGHDFRYAMNCSKLKNLGWKPDTSFSDALQETVQWYRLHIDWWKKIKENRRYQEYAQRQYKTVI
ncbi:MAG: dTDP-glucose 4,6-dehydratase [Elusimicrobia bacterium]|nr:dTDP-glucose 4,6-dehydratase [Elusimicrobiota bacterium]